MGIEWCNESCVKRMRMCELKEGGEKAEQHDWIISSTIFTIPLCKRDNNFTQSKPLINPPVSAHPHKLD